MGKLGAIQFRKNLKLNTRPKKLVRFRHALFLTTTTVRREFKYATKIGHGEFGGERLCSIVQLVHKVLNCHVFYCTKLACAGSRTSKYCHSFRRGEELGNLQQCEFYAPDKPLACLEGCTPFYHSKGFSMQASFGFYCQQ